jgi:hypothetical protein
MTFVRYMHLWAVPLFICTVGAVVSTPQSASARQLSKPNLTDFTARRDLCDHFRGEEAYDTARAREIAAGVKRYCTGTDQELRQLRKKYARNPNVLERLKRYEDSVE